MDDYKEKKAIRNEILRKNFYDGHFIFDPEQDLKEFEEEKNSHNKRLEQKKKFKEKVYDIGVDSALHGLPIILKSSGFKRMRWIFIFILALGACLYLSVLAILGYLEYETTTQIRYVNELPGMFPTITVCNTNPFTTDYSIDFIKTIMSNYSLIEPGTQPFDAVNLSNDKLDTIVYLARAYAKSDYFSQENKRSLGFSLENFILGCKYNFYDCDMRDWTWYYDFYYGNCYAFNTGLNRTGGVIDWKTMIKADKADALKLELYVGEKTGLQTLFPNRGVIVKVHNITTLPSDVQGYNGPTGLETSIVINRMHREFLPYPYSECLIDTLNPIEYDSVLYNLIINSNYSYSQSSCYNQCYQQQIIEACGCFDISYNSLFSDVIPCLTLSQINCLKPIYTRYVNEDPFNRCGKLCPLECNTITFRMAKGSLQFPAPSYANLFMAQPNVQAAFPGNTLTYAKVKDNFARVAIYYQTNIYEHITEYETSTIAAFIAYLGGYSGLFLGVSTTTIGEVLEILIEYLIGWYSNVVVQMKF